MPFYQKFGGLLLGRIIYSSKNISVSVLDPPFYPCVAKEHALWKSFRISRLGQLYIGEFDYANIIDTLF
jgi:hypothetical protein